MHSRSQKRTYLFVLPWSLNKIGGVNQVVINLAREMQKAGDFLPMVLINDWSATHPIVETVQGIKTVRWRLRSYREDMGLKEKLAFFLWEGKFSRDFYRFCIEHKVISINPHFPGLATFAIERVIKKLLTTIPLVLSFHGSDVSAIASAGDVQLTQWRRLLSRPSTKVVVCSNNLGKRLVEVAGCEVSPLVVHNGLDVAAFSSLENGPTSSGDRMILNIARFEEKKGQDVLINAFVDVLAKYEDIKLVFVGATDAALPDLRALCVKKGISKWVEFYTDTPHDQVADFYKRATLFCLPSRVEPFGIVILEAASFAVPVVASRTGGIPEIVTDGVNGMLVPPDNHFELANSIISLLDDPVAAQEMGKRLSQHVRINFSWTAAYKKYVDIVSKTGVDFLANPIK